MIPFIPLQLLWMCFKPFFFLPRVQFKGKEFWWFQVFWFHPSLSTKVRQISSQATFTLHATLHALFIAWNYPWSISESELIHHPVKLFATFNTSLVHISITLDLKFLSFFFSPFLFNLEPYKLEQHAIKNEPCHNNQPLSIDQFNTTVNTVWHIDFAPWKGKSGDKLWRNVGSLFGHINRTVFHFSHVDSNDDGFQV